MNLSPRHDPHARADVCLILEGTYPYVRGGVSSWIRQIIENMPQLQFSIIFLGAAEADYGAPAYELPDNLVHLEVHMLLDAGAVANPIRSRRARAVIADSARVENQRLHECLATGKTGLDTDVTASFTELLTGPERIEARDLEQSREAWELVTHCYEAAPSGLDFNHYFWTVRGMHEPLFRLADIALQAPVATVYHAVSTGYAGFLGAMLKQRHASVFLISEHGIYTKERELDLAQVDWIPGNLDPFKVGINDDMSYLRSLWINFFKSLGRMAYGSADRIHTLYEGNRQRQLIDGAPEDRLTIIPNGVDIERFAPHRRAADAPVPPVIALVGRIVPIKDIKCFIRAMRIVRSRLPDAEGWLIGPDDEVPAYTEECRLLVDNLKLADTVHFLGFRKPEDIFPQIGLCVLTSVSEGQPLVLLEGFAAGIPTVTTDVGSCRELVLGDTAEDRALGAAGRVVPIANPAAFADAVVELLVNRERWCAARDAGIARVHRFYDQKDMIERYRGVYDDSIATHDKAA